MDFRGSQWTTDKILQKIGDKRIRSLGLLETSACDRLLLELASRASSLTSLEVVSQLISDEGISEIARRSSIVSLLIHEAPRVTDAALPAIASCGSLKELYLAGTAVTDRGIGLIAELPELGALDVSNTTITDAGIHEIGSRSIDLISFDECDITGSGFATWSINAKMSFYGKDSSLNNEGFTVACQSMPWMWNVVIENTSVGDAGLMALGPDGPTSIRLRGTNVTLRGIEWLVANTPVQGIEADSSQITEAQAKGLQRVRSDLSIYVG